MFPLINIYRIINIFRENIVCKNEKYFESILSFEHKLNRLFLHILNFHKIDNIIEYFDWTIKNKFEI